MRKRSFISVALAALIGLLAALSLVGAAGCGKNKIVIWTSGEDYRNTFYLEQLTEKFPQYNIRLEYVESGTIANKILAEKNNCSADIILSQEYGYLDKSVRIATAHGKRRARFAAYTFGKPIDKGNVGRAQKTV